MFLLHFSSIIHTFDRSNRMWAGSKAGVSKRLPAGDYYMLSMTWPPGFCKRLNEQENFNLDCDDNVPEKWQIHGMFYTKLTETKVIYYRECLVKQELDDLEKMKNEGLKCKHVNEAQELLKASKLWYKGRCINIVTICIK